MRDHLVDRAYREILHMAQEGKTAACIDTLGRLHDAAFTEGRLAGTPPAGAGASSGSRADRLANRHKPPHNGEPWPYGPLDCDDGRPHRWQPVSFVFETQLLDTYGRVVVRQPDIRSARVYVVCMVCRSYSYIEAESAGYFLGGPPSRDDDET